MAAVRDFEELATFQKAREHSGYIEREEYCELYAECRRLSAGVMNFIKEIDASDITGAKYRA